MSPSVIKFCIDKILTYIKNKINKKRTACCRPLNLYSFEQKHKTGKNNKESKIES